MEGIITDEELAARWEGENLGGYTWVFGPRYDMIPILQDIIKKADDVLDGRTQRVADLRFGHDSGLWPLAGFLDLEGPGDRVKAADAPSACPSWKWLPMAANFQMILYRNAQGEILVKFLWNEREMRVRGVTPVSGPYYKWSDIRPRMVDAIPAL